MSRYKLSICIPVHNPGTYLADAMGSVLTQSYSDFELLIIDDASEQPVDKIVSSLKDPRTRFVTNPRNLGLVGNWNRCLELSHGEYVCIFHQDDVMEAGFLASSVAALDSNPGASFSFTNMNQTDASGKAIGVHWSQSLLPASDTVFDGLDLIRLMCQHGNLVPCASVVARASALGRAGRFDSRLEFTPDFEMWLRMCLQGTAIYLSSPHVNIRRHQLQTTTRFLGLGALLEMRRAFGIFFSEHRDSLPDSIALVRAANTHLRRWAIWMARDAVRKGQLSNALTLMIESCRTVLTT